MKDAGHLLSLERPDDVTSYIEAFLKEHTRLQRNEAGLLIIVPID